MTNLATHWDQAYSSKTAAERSWTEVVPRESLELATKFTVDVDAPVIDIGGGASHLVDELLKHGFTDVTLLDIAESALNETQRRLKENTLKDNVSYICADITKWMPERAYSLWHDRAVFHFLTDVNDRNLYVAKASAAIAPGGHLVLATFAPTGPESCSGLPVQRWSTDELAALFAESFTLVESRHTTHITPWDSEQPFSWVVLKRK